MLEICLSVILSTVCGCHLPIVLSISCRFNYYPIFRLVHISLYCSIYLYDMYVLPFGIIKSNNYYHSYPRPQPAVVQLRIQRNGKSLNASFLPARRSA